MTPYEILVYIENQTDGNGRKIFHPSKDVGEYTIIGQNGKEKKIQHICSYYRTVRSVVDDKIEKVEIRVADHGTTIRRWFDGERTPQSNRQNVNITFTPNGLPNNDPRCDDFLVIEQFAYRNNDITSKDLDKIINQILGMPQSDFKDPTGKANYRVIQSTDFDYNPQPLPTEGIHQNQLKALEKYKTQTESKNMKQTIRLTESQLHSIIKNCVNEALNEESYRKAAKRGEHTSSALKRALNFAQSEYGRKPKDFHKYADKYGLDKKNHNSICDYEDRVDNNGKPVDESCYKSKQTIKLSESKLRNIIRESVKKCLYERQADSRPLHRKGSLNRAMDDFNESKRRRRTVKLTESELRKMIAEVSKTVINEHGSGNDWDKRAEWNNFEDPLVTRSKRRNNTSSVYALLRRIINSPWWKMLQQNGCRPDFHCVATVSFDEDEEIGTLDSTDIEEIRDFYEQYEDGRNSYNIYIYCYTDNIGDNVPNSAIENIIYAAGEGCFNIQDYDYYEPRINDVLKKYINKKRLNNV